MKLMLKLVLLIGVVLLGIALTTCLLTGYAVLSVLTSGFVWVFSKAGLTILCCILGWVTCKLVFKIISN